MSVEITIGETDAARRDIFRHRYDVCCGELKQYLEVADHGARLLREAADEGARHCAARDEGNLVGSMRWVLGGDGPFTPGHVERYRLGALLENVPEAQIVIGERIVVSPAHGGGDVISAMFTHLMAFVNDHRIQLVVCACHPQLLNLYTGLGFRPYASANIDSADSGYLVPLMLVAEDIAYLRKIRSPLAKSLRDFGAGASVPPAAIQLVEGQSAITSARLSTPKAYWRALQAAYAPGGAETLHLFEGLSNDEIRTVVKNSALIECRANDLVLKKREVARNMYVVLSGSLEVRDGDRYFATLMPGDIIGEIAFLLSTPRTADVVAMMDGTRLLSFSETMVQDLVERHPALAARFMLNVAKLLCAKLAFRAM